MERKIIDKIFEITERFFGTANDPDQMPVNKESLRKLQELHPKSFIYKTDNDEPISWVVVLPTSDELMKKFLDNEINERELLNLTQPQDRYEALYLCSAFTVPEHRGKGYAAALFQEAITQIPHSKDVKLFAWPFSEEGKQLADKLSSIFGKKILIKT